MTNMGQNGPMIKVGKSSWLLARSTVKHNFRHFPNTEPQGSQCRLFVHSFNLFLALFLEGREVRVQLHWQRLFKGPPHQTEHQAGARRRQCYKVKPKRWQLNKNENQRKSSPKEEKSTALEDGGDVEQEARLKKTRWLATREEPSRLHMYIHV